MASSSSSSSSSPPDSVINQTFTETKWAAQITSTLNLPDLQRLTETTPFSIFPIPEPLKSTSPESYSPELIAVGPLHHFSPQLFPMQTYKLAAAKRSLDLLQFPDFEAFIEQRVSGSVPRIRASHDKHLDAGDEAIALISAVDGLFLIDFLIGNCREDGQKVTGDKIRRDLVKLENQIPLFLLKEMAPANEELAGRMVEFAGQVSPFDLHKGGYPEGIEFQHLLDFIYKMVLLKDREQRSRPERRAAVEVLWEEAKNADTFGVVQPVDRVIRLLNAVGIPERVRKALGDDDEGVLIPTAFQLKAAGISFGRSKDGVRSFRYNAYTKTLSLPSFEVKPDCEVLMRNLLAYEFAVKSEESLVLNRYAQIMGCLVRTVVDVKLLREEMIIVAEEEEDEEMILEVFRGMAAATDSIDRKDKTVFDGHVKAVNEHYNGQRRIRMGRAVRKYVNVSWDVVKVMAVLLLLAMLGVQTFCDVYNCKVSF